MYIYMCFCVYVCIRMCLYLNIYAYIYTQILQTEARITLQGGIHSFSSEIASWKRKHVTL